MDDRELEARVRAHLHKRFDAAQPSPELVAGVAQALATRPDPIGLAALRNRPVRLGFAFALVAAVAAIVLVGSNLKIATGPGGTPSSPPGTTGVALPGDRTFVVVPRFDATPLLADSQRARAVFDTRLSVLGVERMEVAVRSGIVYTLPADGPSDAAIWDVVGATGDVAFVPLPASDYGFGKLIAEVGQPLPKDEPALFGWDGIDGVELDRNEPTASLLFTLRDTARQALADYAASHVGEQLALVIDGDVGLLATVAAPRSDGTLRIPSEAASQDPSFVAAAILLGGLLPESWHGAQVHSVLSQSEAVGRAIDDMRLQIDRGEVQGARVGGLAAAVLDVVRYQEGLWLPDATPSGPSLWMPVWNIVLDGTFPFLCPSPAPEAQPCDPPTRMRIYLDASNGSPLWTGPAASP